MAVREGKVYVYCNKCFYLKFGWQCWNPNNIDINHWKKPKPFEKAEKINKNNDCKWYMKSKWYHAFGWGTRP
jgi:hypothetical protein